MESRLRYLRLYVELVSFFVALVEELGDDEVSGTQLHVPQRHHVPGTAARSWTSHGLLMAAISHVVIRTLLNN